MKVVSNDCCVINSHVTNLSKQIKTTTSYYDTAFENLNMSKLDGWDHEIVVEILARAVTI